MFAGSQSVGGADGDLIAGKCLVDFKAIKEPKLEARMIHQVTLSGPPPPSSITLRWIAVTTIARAFDGNS
jgi:hypothetical protein